MGTQGILSVVKEGVMLAKVITGSNGQKIPEVAKRLLEDLRGRGNTVTPCGLLGSVVASCVECGFDLEDEGFVIQTSETGEVQDGRDDLPQLYRFTFAVPWFNPRWDRGTADYVRVIVIAGGEVKELTPRYDLASDAGIQAGPKMGLAEAVSIVTAAALRSLTASNFLDGEGQRIRSAVLLHRKHMDNLLKFLEEMGERSTGEGTDHGK